ncbi:MAG: uracil-DNA glycosylase, partial [Shewanella sp.]
MVTWQAFIDHQRTQPYYQQLIAFVNQERQVGKVIYPPKEDV